MQITNVVEWSRAVTLIMTNEAYTLMPRSDGSLIRAATIAVPKPLVVCLNRYVPKLDKVFKNTETVSKRMILNRDDYKCQYCSNYGDTVDHIHPKSRGGPNTWGNLCAACKECNGLKADKTPAEAGLKTPIIPASYTSHRRQRIQETIYEALTEIMM